MSQHNARFVSSPWPNNRKSLALQHRESRLSHRVGSAHLFDIASLAAVLRSGFATKIGPILRKRKTVSATGRSCGGPSEKFAGVIGGIYRSCSQKLCLCRNLQLQDILGHLLRILLQNPPNFSEVAAEVRPAVATGFSVLHLFPPSGLLWLVCPCAGEKEDGGSF